MSTTYGEDPSPSQVAVDVVVILVAAFICHATGRYSVSEIVGWDLLDDGFVYMLSDLNQLGRFGGVSGVVGTMASGVFALAFSAAVIAALTAGVAFGLCGTSIVLRGALRLAYLKLGRLGRLVMSTCAGVPHQ